MAEYVSHARNSFWDLVPANLKQSADFINACARGAPASIRKGKHPSLHLLTEETIIAAMQVPGANAGTVIRNLNAGQKTEAICIAATRIDWHLYKLAPLSVAANTENLRNIALRESPYALQYFPGPKVTYEVAIAWHQRLDFAAPRRYDAGERKMLKKCISLIVSKLPVTRDYFVYALSHGLLTPPVIEHYAQNLPGDDREIADIERIRRHEVALDADIMMSFFIGEIRVANRQVDIICSRQGFTPSNWTRIVINDASLEVPVFSDFIPMRINAQNAALNAEAANHAAAFHAFGARFAPDERAARPAPLQNVRVVVNGANIVVRRPVAAAAAAAPRNYQEEDPDTISRATAEKRAADIVSLMRAKASEFAAVSAPLPEAGEIICVQGHNPGQKPCFICMNDFEVGAKYVMCACGAGHAFCFNCFEFAVRVQCDTKADTFNPAAWRAQHGRVACCPGAPVVFGAAIVAHACPEHIGIYIASTNEFSATREREAASAASAAAAASVAEKALKALISPSYLSPVAAAVKHIQDQILTRRCPACKAPFSDFTDCSSVSCDCGAHFCGLCLGFHSPDKHETHRHVLTCQFNPNAGSSYAFVDHVVNQNIAIATGNAIVNYINTLPVTKSSKSEIVFAVAKDAADGHIPEYIMNTFMEQLYGE